MRGIVSLLAVLLFATGCEESRYSLVQNVADSEKRFQDGRYPGFIDDAGDQGLVELAGDTRPALTPPFPASLRFDVTLPEAAFLTLAPALITRQRVGRARVEFVVVETPDGERTTVLSELLRHTETNQWHPREVDLTRWAGQSVIGEQRHEIRAARECMPQTDHVPGVGERVGAVELVDPSHRLGAGEQTVLRISHEELERSGRTATVVGSDCNGSTTMARTSSFERS